MKKFFKRLFCKHVYRYDGVRLVDTGMRKAISYKCEKCGRIKMVVI